MESRQNINALIAKNRIDEALTSLDKIIETNPSDAEALFARGKLLWRQGERHRAMGDYARAAELNPDGPAAMALDNAREIDAFYCRDLYNP